MGTDFRNNRKKGKADIREKRALRRLRAFDPKYSPPGSSTDDFVRTHSLSHKYSSLRLLCLGLRLPKSYVHRLVKSDSGLSIVHCDSTLLSSIMHTLGDQPGMAKLHRMMTDWKEQKQDPRVILNEVGPVLASFWDLNDRATMIRKEVEPPAELDPPRHFGESDQIPDSLKKLLQRLKDDLENL